MELQRFDGVGSGCRAPTFNALRDQAHMAIEFHEALALVLDGLDVYEIADMIGSQNDIDSLAQATVIHKLLQETD